MPIRGISRQPQGSPIDWRRLPTSERSVMVPMTGMPPAEAVGTQGYSRSGKPSTVAGPKLTGITRPDAPSIAETPVSIPLA